MKFVNPNILNIERDFRYNELVTNCKDFKDLYTNSNIECNGCYGCENLDEKYNMECKKKYRVKFGWIRKDEDNYFVKNCLDFAGRTMYTKDGYVENGCDKCMHLQSRTLGRCECKHDIKQELYRIG